MRTALETQLLETLKDIKNFGAENQRYGICHAIENQWNGGSDEFYPDEDRISEARDRLFESWPKFSGHLGYPVPAADDPGNREAAEYAYDDAMDNEGAWAGAYGALRRELLDHMIAELEKR